MPAVDLALDVLLKLVQMLTELSLCFLGCLLELIVNLSKNAVLARHPKIAEYFPLGFGFHLTQSIPKRKLRVRECFQQGARRIIRQLENGVRHLSRIRQTLSFRTAQRRGLCCSLTTSKKSRLLTRSLRALRGCEWLGMTRIKFES